MDALDEKFEAALAALWELQSQNVTEINRLQISGQGGSLRCKSLIAVNDDIITAIIRIQAAKNTALSG